MPCLGAQSARPRFDVTSVSPAATGTASSSVAPGVLVFQRRSVTVAELVQFAYGVMDFQLVGGPDWIASERFNVSANANRMPSEDELLLMVQSLLDERFALRLRTDVRQTTQYFLKVAESGHLGTRLRRCDNPNAPPASVPIRIPPGTVPMMGSCRPIATVAKSCSVKLGAPVLDRSELEGLWTYEVLLPKPAADEPLELQLATALREQLGLALERGAGPLQVLVVQSAQRPKSD